MTDPSFLRLENLSKSFLEGSVSRHVLQDVTAGFTRGEITAIIGKSGSGKSTLLNLVSGIDQADHGRIYLDGIELGLRYCDLDGIRLDNDYYKGCYCPMVPCWAGASSFSPPQ